MALRDYFDEPSEIGPIDVVESIALLRAWEFDRLSHDQIAMVFEGQWRNYALTLNWCDREETLRSVCTFEMDPPRAQNGAIYELINLANEHCWSGQFTWWPDQSLMVYKYGLLLTGGAEVSQPQLERMMSAAIQACERFYPAFQLVSWAGCSAEDAMQAAIAEAYGRA